MLSPDQPPMTPLIGATLAGGLGLQLLAFLLPPLRRLLGLTPLGPLDVAVSLLGATGPFVVNEAVKLIRGPSSPAAREPLP